MERQNPNVKGDELQKVVKLRKIEPNKNQPRKVFDEAALQELAQSIKNYGLIQPLVVRQKGSGYEIIAGERRWRAARLAGLRDVPVIIREYSEQEVAEIALVENLQREDLNPVETAQAYQTLLSEYGMTQEELAKKVGKSRSVISNSVRFLKLDDIVKDMLATGSISEGHAKVLLSLNNKEEQRKLAETIAAQNLSVRQTEEKVRELQNQDKKIKMNQLQNQEIYDALADKINEKVGTKVSIRRKTENTGKIEIEYYSIEDLDRISRLIG